MVQEAKSPVKYLVKQRCADGFNSDVEGLNRRYISRLIQSPSLKHYIVFAVSYGMLCRLGNVTV
jgi:hypothetical protein